MLIQKVDPTHEAFSDYSLEGAILTIGGIKVDLEAEQKDQEVIVTFSDDNGMIHRGMTPCCKYVAEALIPPRQYLSVEVAGPPANDFSGGGGNNSEAAVPSTHTETTLVPLDVDSVILKLWPTEDGRQETDMAEGAENAD
jgi:hypothetical protein